MIHILGMLSVYGKEDDEEYQLYKENKEQLYDKIVIRSGKQKFTLPTKEYKNSDHLTFLMHKFIDSFQIKYLLF